MKFLPFIFLLIVPTSISAQNSHIAFQGDTETFKILIHIPPTAALEEFATADQGKIIIDNANLPITSRLPREVIQRFEIVENRSTDTKQTEFSCLCNISISQSIENFVILELSDREGQPEPAAATAQDESIIIFEQWWGQENDQRARASSTQQTSIQSSRWQQLLAQQEGVQQVSLPSTEEPIESAEHNVIEVMERDIGVGIQADTNDDTDRTNNTPECAIKHLFIQESTLDQQETKALSWAPHRITKTTGHLSESQLMTELVFLMANGLAAEAREIFDTMDNSRAEIATLQKINEIMGNIDNISSKPTDLPQCGTDITLWQHLVNSSLQPNSTDSKSLLLQYKALKRPLQILLSKRIANLLHKGSYSEELEHYMITNRIPYAYTTLPQNRHDRLGQIMLANRNDPQGIINLLQNRTAKIPNSMIELAESIRHESQGTPMWKEILTAEVSKHIDLEEFTEAQSKIALLRQNGSEAPLIDQLYGELSEAIATHGSPTTILSIYTTDDMKIWPNPARRRLEERVAELNLGGLIDDTIIQSNAPLSGGFMTGTDGPTVNFSQDQNNMSTQRLQDIIDSASSLRGEVLELTE